MFFLFANCNFIPDHYDAWQSAYDDLAEHVWANEPTTMAYYFGIPLEYSDDFSKTTSMFAFEVYGRREDLYETHLNSPAMGKFLASIPEHTTTDLDLNHYTSLGGGFLDREGDKRECVIMFDQRIGCKSSAAREAVAGRLTALCTQVKDSVEVESAGVLTFMAFSCLDNDTGLRIYSRFESKIALQRFLRRQDVLDFWKESKSHVASMEARGYLPNGKGWLHRNGGTVESGKKL